MFSITLNLKKHKNSPLRLFNKYIKIRRICLYDKADLLTACYTKVKYLLTYRYFIIYAFKLYLPPIHAPEANVLETNLSIY